MEHAACRLRGQLLAIPGAIAEAIARGLRKTRELFAVPANDRDSQSRLGPLTALGPPLPGEALEITVRGTRNKFAEAGSKVVEGVGLDGVWVQAVVARRPATDDPPPRAPRAGRRR